MTIIDPKTDISANDLPLIVFAAHTSKFISWIIRWKTQGSYNHVMWMHKKDLFASQVAKYKEMPLSDYMKAGFKLKFVKIREMTVVQKKLINKRIEKKLGTSYDWLGIIGQALGIKWLNNPWKNFCSESVAEDLDKIMNDIPSKPSPRDLNEYVKDNLDRFKILGYWLTD